MFRYIKRVGKGIGENVIMVQNIKSFDLLAIKKLKKYYESEDELNMYSIRELTILKSLEHENIVKYFEYMSNSMNLFIFMEVLDCSLKDYIPTLFQKNNETKYYILQQILFGLEYIHDKNLLHRDLKPQNILIKGKQIKIADFGLSKWKIPDSQDTPGMVTLWYRAPEILIGSREYTNAIDIWSFGCIYYEMFHGSPLFTAESEIQMLKQIFMLIGFPDKSSFDHYNVMCYIDYIQSIDINKYPTLCLLMEIFTFIDSSRPSATDLLKLYKNKYDVNIDTSMNLKAELSASLPEDWAEIFSKKQFSL